MTNNNYPNSKTLIINLLTKLAVYQSLKECRREFINNAFICFLCIKGKINFLQIPFLEGNIILFGIIQKNDCANYILFRNASPCFSNPGLLSRANIFFL